MGFFFQAYLSRKWGALYLSQEGTPKGEIHWPLHNDFKHFTLNGNLNKYLCSNVVQDSKGANYLLDTESHLKNENVWHVFVLMVGRGLFFFFLNKYSDCMSHVSVDLKLTALCYHVRFWPIIKKSTRHSGEVSLPVVPEYLFKSWETGANVWNANVPQNKCACITKSSEARS